MTSSSVVKVVEGCGVWCVVCAWCVVSDVWCGSVKAVFALVHVYFPGTPGSYGALCKFPMRSGVRLIMSRRSVCCGCLFGVLCVLCILWHGECSVCFCCYMQFLQSECGIQSAEDCYALTSPLLAEKQVVCLYVCFQLLCMCGVVGGLV